MELTERPGNDGGGRGGRRRRRRRRRGGTNRSRNPQQQQQQQQQRRIDPDDCRFQSSGQRTGGRIEGPGDLNPFALFCAYHLGVTADNGYRFQSISDIARRFNVDVDVIKDRLTRYGLQTEELKKIGFESSFFQPDIQVAPEGVNKTEIARSIWEEFVDQIDIKPDPEPEPEPEPEEEEVIEAEAEEDDSLDADETDAEAEPAEVSVEDVVAEEDVEADDAEAAKEEG